MSARGVLFVAAASMFFSGCLSPGGAAPSGKDLFSIDSISSENQEQLFTPGEAIKFAVKLSSGAAEPANLRFRYCIRGVDEEVIREEEGTVQFPAGGTIEKSVEPAVEDVGFYRLEIALAGKGWERRAATNFGVVPEFGSEFIDDSAFCWHRFGPAHMRSLQKVGVKWVRGDNFCSWHNVEPKQGTFDFRSTDAVVNGAAECGIRCLLILDYLPDWMVPAGYGGYVYGYEHIPMRLGPAELDEQQRIDLGNDDYAAFSGRMVEHYKGTVPAWEIWNEPEFYWAGTPEQYVAMLKKAYAAMKKADADCTVALAAPVGRTVYLEKMYEAGAKGHFDVVTLHYFRSHDPYEIRKVVRSFREVMAKYGDEDLPIWNTEEKTGPVRGIFAHVMAKVEGVDKVFLFPTWRPNDGIVAEDGTPTPIAVAHAVLAKHLEGARFEREINLGRRRDAFLFNGNPKHFGAEPFAVGWSCDNAAEVMMSGARGKDVTLVDPYGRRKQVSVEDGMFLVRLGGKDDEFFLSFAPGPVYIEGISEKLDWRVALDLDLPENFSSGEANEITVIVLHQLEKETGARLRLSVPKGWKVVPADHIEVPLDPEKKKLIHRLTVEPPKGQSAAGTIEAVLMGAAGRMASVCQGCPAPNIALEAKVTTPDGLKQEQDLPADEADVAINDGDYRTFSQKVGGAKEYIVQFDWDEPRCFNAMRIVGGVGTGLESFDIICDGKLVATAEGLRYERLEAGQGSSLASARFEEVKAKTLRLRVFKCCGDTPHIREIEIYRLPEKQGRGLPEGEEFFGKRQR